MVELHCVSRRQLLPRHPLADDPRESDHHAGLRGHRLPDRLLPGARRRGSRTWVVLILLLPLVTSPVVVSYGWLVLLGNTGVVNDTLTRLGIVSQPLRLIYSQTGIVIGLVQVLLSFMVLSLGAALRKSTWALSAQHELAHPLGKRSGGSSSRCSPGCALGASWSSR